MTLKEHRKKVLKEQLRVVSARSGFSIPTHFRVEHGICVPAPWNLDKFAKAYRLTVEEFQKLLANRKNSKPV